MTTAEFYPAIRRMFRPYCIPNPAREKRAWTPKRIAAAKRSVKRELDQVPLFPELARFSTVEERQAFIQAGEDAWAEDMRAHHAKAIREARAKMRQLSHHEQMGLRLYWERSLMPRDPVYLLGRIRDIEQGKSAWDWIKEMDELPEKGRIWREKNNWDNRTEPNEAATA